LLQSFNPFKYEITPDPTIPAESLILDSLKSLILDSLKSLKEWEMTPNTWIEDMKDEPEAYLVTADEVEAALFKWEIPINQIPE